MKHISINPLATGVPEVIAGAGWRINRDAPTHYRCGRPDCTTSHSTNLSAQVCYRRKNCTLIHPYETRSGIRVPGNCIMTRTFGARVWFKAVCPYCRTEFPFPKKCVDELRLNPEAMPTRDNRSVPSCQELDGWQNWYWYPDIPWMSVNDGSKSE